MSDSVTVVWDDEFLAYDMGPEHPLNPVRLALTVSLARQLGVLDRPNVTVMPPRPAGEDLLTLVHDPEYLEVVRAAPEHPWGVGHGFGSADNPVFPHMYEASALITGGSVLAAEQVWSGASQHAVNIAGGLHHAMRARAAGFCVFNDPAIAIARLLELGADRVAYVDVDVHHGDGVQAAFYGDPRVLTISLHQSPLTLFPGTGFPDEVGRGNAAGASVNVALPAGTDDEGWHRAFDAVAPALLRAFRPQVLVTQSGCDTHHEDPLAELSLTVDGQRSSYMLLHDLAHELCDGRWIAFGGGGYGLVRCVPRAWTHLLAEATGERIAPGSEIPEAWLDEVGRRGLRTPPPRAMTELRPAPQAIAWRRWEPGEDSPLARAIIATRRAVFPLHGLDPDDPRD
ncbi:MAG TPA: acetoin utilization protein AcuC [Mycobacteriales bacterium]|nr:acetoin utilization protein AcuC [Mycobacteriales bacterium]